MQLGNIINRCFLLLKHRFHQYWLVVWNIFYFPFHIWDVILPIDFHSIIFQDGEIAPPTREKLFGKCPTFDPGPNWDPIMDLEPSGQR